MIWILLTFFAMAEVEEAPTPNVLPFDEIANRAISTVVESRVTRQFSEVPQIAKCLEDSNNLVKESDLNSGTKEEVRAKVRQAQLNASACVKKELDSVQPQDLDRISESLGLREYGLVKGKGSKAVVDFFTARFENIFYTTKNGKRDRMVVDQAFFFDMYESQLGKSVLLELSNYCVNSLDSTTPNTSRSAFYNAVKSSRPDDVTAYTDTYTPPTRQASTPNSPPPDPNKVYEEFLNDVVGTSPGTSAAIDPTTTSKRLSDIYQGCAAKIPGLCKIYQECECEFRKKLASAKSETAPTCDGLPAAESGNYDTRCVSGIPTEIKIGSTTIKEPNRGRNSCHVEARLRGYRGNLKATNLQQTLLGSNYSGGKVIARDARNGVGQDNVYRSGEESIDDLTSLSSKEIDSIKKDNKMSEECENDPSKENCKDFAFGEDEATKFANTAASYAATTEVEVRKLKSIENDKTKLIGFLKSKGYLDLVAEVEKGGPRSTSDIVVTATQRFEAQREATFGEISKAFERRQLVGDQATRESKVKEIKADIENRGNDFKQLMLFNNVVTSFLQIEKKNQDGEYESAGSNVRSLQREISGNNALEGLSGLATESTQIGKGDSPIVDQTFIDGILGEANAMKDSRPQSQQPR